jgi:MFS family permease
MLALVCFGEIAQGLLYFSAVPLVLAVERDLHLAASQVAFWVNLRLMFVFFLAIPIGLAIDWQGAKRIGRIGFLLLGIGATARGLANSYETLLIATCLYALGSMTLSVCLPKALATWFSAREIGMASWLYLSGYGIGASLALSVVHPLFGGNWEQCLKVTGSVGILAAVLWWAFAKEAEKNVSPRPIVGRQISLGVALQQAASSPTTWILTAIFFLYAAGFTSWFTFAFAFLARYRSVSQNSAGVLLMITMIGYTVAALTMPALSDRIGYRRPFLIGFSIMAAFLFTALIYWKTFMGIGISAFLIGTFFGTTNPLIFTIAAESGDLGPTLMGIVVGLISSVSSIGGFVVPTLTGKYLGALSSASEHRFHVVLAVSAAYVGAVSLVALPLRETGHGSLVARSNATRMAKAHIDL